VMGLTCQTIIMWDISGLLGPEISHMMDPVAGARVRGGR